MSGHPRWGLPVIPPAPTTHTLLTGFKVSRAMESERQRGREGDQEEKALKETDRGVTMVTQAPFTCFSSAQVLGSRPGFSMPVV